MFQQVGLAELALVRMVWNLMSWPISRAHKRHTETILIRSNRYFAVFLILLVAWVFSISTVYTLTLFLGIIPSASVAMVGFFCIIALGLWGCHWVYVIVDILTPPSRSRWAWRSKE